MSEKALASACRNRGVLCAECRRLAREGALRGGRSLPGLSGRLIDEHKYAAVFDSYPIGLEINARRDSFCLSSDEIESPVVFGALDDRAHDQAAGEVSLLVGTQCIGSEEAIVGGAIDGKRPRAVLEAHHVLLAQVVDLASLRPHLGTHCCAAPRRVAELALRGLLATVFIRRRSPAQQLAHDEHPLRVWIAATDAPRTSSDPVADEERPG